MKRVRLLLLVASITFSWLAASLAIALTIPVPRRRELSPLEAMAKLVDDHEFVALVRVRSVWAPIPHEYDPLNPPLLNELPVTEFRLRSRIEVVEWIRGRSDSIEFDIDAREGGFLDRRAWRALAGSDSTGALVLLFREGGQWMLGWDADAGLRTGYRPVPLHAFSAVSDSVRTARAGLDLDSLVNRADLIVVANATRRTYSHQPTLVTADRVLKGSAPETLQVLAPLTGLQPGRLLLLLVRVGDGYETIPVHRGPWAADSVGTQDDRGFTAREGEVVAAVKRWKRSHSGPGSQ